jgi:hypothetical protein
VHLQSKTHTIPQTAYDDHNDYNDYDVLRAQVLCTIEPAIDKSSANDPLTLSKQKLLAAQALMATLDNNVKSISIQHRNTGYGKQVHEVQYRIEVARCNAYGLLSTAAQPASS